MRVKRALVVSQVIPQWYVDLLTNALGPDFEIDFMTGSIIKGNRIQSPKHDPRSMKSRLLCWAKHYQFAMHWLQKNKDQHYDLVFAVSNPPINPAIALKMKKQFHAPFIYMNWDLYPQVIAAQIKNPIAQFVCRLWSNWNSRHFIKIDRMLTIGDVMAESLNADLNSPIPVTVIPIAVDTDRLKPIPKKDNPFCIKYGLSDKFVVLYSGKMGMGHNIELILEAAKRLETEKDIQFVFIGEGPKYDVVQRFIDDNKSQNILLLPLQEEEIFPYSMACGDVGIVTQETSMAHLFMPSKVYSMMACGEAIVGIGTDHDDLNRIIQNSGIGISVTNQSAEELARQLLHLYTTPSQTETYKISARNTAEKIFNFNTISARYRNLFYELLEKK